MLLAVGERKVRRDWGLPRSDIILSAGGCTRMVSCHNFHAFSHLSVLPTFWSCQLQVCLLQRGDTYIFKNAKICFVYIYYTCPPHIRCDIYVLKIFQSGTRNLVKPVRSKRKFMRIYKRELCIWCKYCISWEIHIIIWMISWYKDCLDVLLTKS